LQYPGTLLCLEFAQKKVQARPEKETPVLREAFGFDILLQKLYLKI